MDLVSKGRLTGCVILIVLLAVAIGAMNWYLRLFEMESNNRHFLRELVHWSVDELRLNPELKLDALAAATLGRAQRSSAYRDRVKGDSVFDYWGTEIRFRLLGNGEFEWRSAGKDQTFDTADDRFARGKPGAVTVSPL